MPWCEWGEATPDIAYGDSASKVKYNAALSMDYEDNDWFRMKIRRSPENDLFAPMLDECLKAVPRVQQRILAHANGNDTSSYGFRDYYCTSKDDPDLLSLVDKGLMGGPVYHKGLLPKNSAYFYLTKTGAKAARSMLPRRRGKKS